MIQAYDQRYIWFLFHPVNRYTFVTAIKLIKNIVAMKSLLYKWLFIGLIWMSNVSFLPHPFYVSVTEIEHNAKDKTLEISCKIFTDDFEKTLRAAYKAHVDLYDATQKTAMDKLVSSYIIKHLLISVNGKQASVQYKGFELQDEAIYSYFEIDQVPSVKKIELTDNILFDYQSQQTNIVHITVNGNRKSNKLENPQDKLIVEF